jgi:AcrR family transcriptional regulator
MEHHKTNGPFVNHISLSKSERILATARSLYSNPSTNSPTMDDVAKAAGIGRATLYRHFKNRDELLLTVLEQEALDIAARVEKKIRNIEQPAEHIIEGMVQAMAEINKNDLMRNIFQSGSSSAVNRLLFESDRLVNVGIGIMLPVVQRAQETGDLKTTMDFETLVEWILRMLVSLVTIPSRKLNSQAAVRKMLHATMLPVLEG